MDIRTPIGLLFTILGVVIGLYGLITIGSEKTYAPSLGINLNLWSGICLLAFGLFMLLPALRAQKKKAAESGSAGKKEEAPRV